MRVISGQARGHRLKAVPGNNTRPTTDKVKEALFSIIGPYFDGDRVLDLFAGTGALGIEALSRGAAVAVFVDAAAPSIDTVRRNLEATRLADRAEVYRNDANRALKALEKKGEPFGLVFLDPPYAMKVCAELMTELAQRKLVADGAIVVAEHHPSNEYAEEFAGFRRIRLAVYGDIALSIYKYAKHTESAKAEQDRQAAAATVDGEGGTQR